MYVYIYIYIDVLEQFQSIKPNQTNTHIYFEREKNAYISSGYSSKVKSFFSLYLLEYTKIS